MDIPGYTIFTGVTPFADHVGPIHQKKLTTEAGVEEHWVALRVDDRHVNVWGFAHGALMTCMAEFALNSPAYVHGGPPTVIMQMSMSFIAPPKKGDIFETCGVLTKGTRTMFFTDAKGYAGGELVFAATGIIKALKAPA
jgi:acyl-coenzyme A thioesterase PaaI-like protein